MRRRLFISLLLLGFLCVVTTACVENDRDEPHGDVNTYLLCKNSWGDEYYTLDNEFCRQDLSFYTNGSGRNLRAFYRTDATGHPVGAPTILTLPFRWIWEDPSQETIIIMYQDNGRSYFENVWVREHYLSGRLDGEMVIFTDSKLLD